jgi:hypothetical protein
MKRVEVNMDGVLRGRVEKYANEQDLSMPQAYAKLLEEGLDYLDRQEQEQHEADATDGEVTEA